MTKSELKAAFGGKISSSAIKDTWSGMPDEPFIQGKWCRVSPAEDGSWDVFICNPADVAAGLTMHRVNSVIRRIEELHGKPLNVHIYDGEASLTLSTEGVLACLKPLGIRRARVMSEESKTAMLQRLHPGKFTPAAATGA